MYSKFHLFDMLLFNNCSHWGVGQTPPPHKPWTWLSILLWPLEWEEYYICHVCREALNIFRTFRFTLCIYILSRWGKGSRKLLLFQPGAWKERCTEKLWAQPVHLEPTPAVSRQGQPTYKPMRKKQMLDIVSHWHFVIISYAARTQKLINAINAYTKMLLVDNFTENQFISLPYFSSPFFLPPSLSCFLLISLSFHSFPLTFPSWNHLNLWIV